MQSQPDNQNLIPILLASVAIDFVGFAIVLPLLPFYAQAFGASSLQVGLVFGIFSLMAVFAPPLWGSISDRVGRRPALLLNLAGTCLGYLWFAFANSLWMLIGARMLAGLNGASIVIAQAYVSDLTTPANRTKFFGYLDAAAGIGFILGPAIGTFLIGNEPENPDFRTPGLVSAFTAGITFLLAFIALPKKSKHYFQKAKTKFIGLNYLISEASLVLKRPFIGTIFSIAFLLLFAGMGVQAIFGLWCAHRFGWGAQEFGYAVMAYCGMTAIIQVTLTGKLALRFGEVNLFFWGACTTALGFIALTLINNMYQFAFVLFLFSFSQAVTSPSLTSLLSQLSGVGQQGKTLGMMQSVVGIAAFLGAIWAGLAFDLLGENWPYWCGAAMVGGGVVIILKNLKNSDINTIIFHRYQKKLIHLFQFLDYDSSGIIELEDFRNTAENLAYARHLARGTEKHKILLDKWIDFGKDLQNFFILIDGKNQNLDLEIWLSYLDRVIDYKFFARHFFEIIDSDQDGNFSMEDFQEFYYAYGLTMTEAEEVFNILDLEQNGYISEKDFANIFKQFMYSRDIQATGNWLLGTSLQSKL